jgi:NADP-dependent 3-hydroxy acid dehydrogenase YdfG
VQINLKGCLLSCQAVLPVMHEQASGAIVDTRPTAPVNHL